MFQFDKLWQAIWKLLKIEMAIYLCSGLQSEQTLGLWLPSYTVVDYFLSDILFFLSRFKSWMMTRISGETLHSKPVYVASCLPWSPVISKCRMEVIYLMYIIYLDIHKNTFWEEHGSKWLLVPETSLFLHLSLLYNNFSL